MLLNSSLVRSLVVSSRIRVPTVQQHAVNILRNNERSGLRLIGLHRNQDHHQQQLWSWRRTFSADASLVESNKKFLTDTLGFNDEKLNQVGPKPTGGNILTRQGGVLETRVNWLKKRFQLNDDEIKKITQRQPNILKSKIETIEVKTEWLTSRLLLDETALRKIILTHPGVLGHSIEDSLEPKFAWLQQRLGLDDVALGKMIQRLPGIMGYSINDKMEATLDWLQQNLLFSDNYDDEEYGNNGLSNYVQRYPALFGYSIEDNLEPTLHFYVKALGDKSKALVLVKQYPDLFGYSLEKRLKPRLKEARDAGMKIDSACLMRIGKHTQKQWQIQLRSQEKELGGKKWGAK